MVNLRAATAEECYRLFEDIKAKLGKELGGDASPVSMDGNAPIHFPDESVPCEECGGRLVARVAKNGKNAGQRFFGCINFPQCHYTQAVA
ncbi:MAG: topoisomerase DNA-binding C4 zinc finger domain-containing protein [bacterium]|nr:topoisomerase DNA-binding C4 zinc finger domain-containing protein [bacterium]